MSMQPERSETVNPAEAQGTIRPGVLEVCGLENVTLVEALAAEMQGWREIAQAPDPFANVLKAAHTTEATILPDTDFQRSSAEIKRVEGICYHEDPASDEISTVSRAQAPVVQESVIQGRENVSKRVHKLKRGIKETEGETHDFIKPGADGLSLEDATRLYASLVDTAAQFPAQRELKTLIELASTEIGARIVDARAVGAQKRPILAERYRQSLRVTALPKTAAHQEGRERRETIRSILRTTGDRSWGVRRAHRGWLDMINDEDALKAASARLEPLQTKGTVIYQAIATFAREAVVDPAEQLFIVLGELKDANAAMLQRGKAELQGEQLEELQGQCLDVERYVAEHAKDTIAALKDAGRKPDLDTRRQLRALAEAPLRRAYEREQKARARNVGVTSVAEKVAPDPNFRKTCTEAKKIVDGGDHLDHPNASQLAKQLHGTTLGSKKTYDLLEMNRV
jgi:hypothetical protein